MSEVLFEVPCPASGCSDKHIRCWYHSECSSNSNYYLTDEGLIRCDHCGKKFNIFDRYWKSSFCEHDSRKTNLKRMIYILATMEVENKISCDFCEKVTKSLIELWKKCENK